MSTDTQDRNALQPADDAGLELAMQELEALEAPGFWSGFATGVTISTAGVASYAATAAAITT